MKHSLLYPAAAAALVFIVSCTQEEKTPDAGLDLVHKSFTLESPKSVLSDRSVSFTSADRFSVFDGVANRLFVPTSGGASVSIEGDALEAASYEIFFPYDREASLSDGVFRTTVPSMQRPVEGGYDPASDIMHATALESSATMSHLCALLKFTIGSDDVASVRVRALGGEGISGKASFSADDLSVKSAASATIVALPSTGSVFARGTYSLCLAPGTLSSGIEVTVRRASGRSEFRSNSAPLQLQAGRITAITGAIDAGDYLTDDSHFIDNAVIPTHPRMFFNSDMLPEIRERAAGSAKSYLATYINHINWMTYEPDLSDHGDDAAKAALTWILTGNPVCLVKAKAMLNQSVAYYAKCSADSVAVDWYSTSRINALCAYDWLYNDLTPAEREAVIVPLVQHVIQTQKAGVTRQTAGTVYGGGYSMASLKWYAGLAALGDGFCDEDARSLLEQGYKYMRELCEFRAKTAGDDGDLSTPTLTYCASMYPYAHFNFFFTCRSATLDDVATSYPGLALFPQFVWWNWIRDDSISTMREAGIGDAFHDRLRSPLSPMYTHITAGNHFYADLCPEAVRFANTMRGFILLEKGSISTAFPAYPFLMDEEIPEDAAVRQSMLSGTVKARHFQTSGEIVMRSGWSEDDTYCTFCTGSDLMREHVHYDQNSFTLYKHDHLALDTGCRGDEDDYNLEYYYSQSVAHNMVLIHKPEETHPSHWGTKLAETVYNYGGTVSNRKQTDLKAFETNSAYTYLASDAAACYGSKCGEAVRQFVYIHPDCFVIYDRVNASDASYRKEWLLHTKDEPELDGALTKVDSDYGDARMFCHTLLPEDASIETIGGLGQEWWANDRNFEINPDVLSRYETQAVEDGRGPYVGGWRLVVSPAEANADDRFLNVITLGDYSMSEPPASTLEKDAATDGVSMTVGGKSYVVRFNRTGTVGGSITVDGVTTPFSTSVQSQSGIVL